MEDRSIDMAALQPGSAPMGTRPAQKGENVGLATGLRRRSTRRTAVLSAVIQAVIVVLLVTTIFIPLAYRTNGPNENEPPYNPTSPIYPASQIAIKGTKEWHDRDEAVSDPYKVVEGAVLGIYDSRLRVYMEDIVLNGRSPFEVQQCGTLGVYNSTISLIADDRLNNSVVLPSGYGFYLGRGMTRVVNLMLAQAPTLELDVCWRVPTTLFVLVQEDPFGNLSLVEELHMKDVPESRWVHHSIPLNGYTARIAKVGVFVTPARDDQVLVSNLTFQDSGRALFGDIPFTGDPSEDGWDLGDLEMFSSYRDSYSWEKFPLIASNGTLVIRGSTIMASDNVPHRHPGYSSWGLLNHPYGVEDGVLVGGSSAGGHIQSRGGNITIEDSVLQDVPVIAFDSMVLVMGCEFNGYDDLMTLADINGWVRTSTFKSTEKPNWWSGDLLDWWWDSQKSIWALGVEGVTDRNNLDILDCTFVGNEVGAILYDANVTLDGCTFTGIEKVAIWDHTTGEAAPVGEYWTGNVFEDLAGQRYILTRHDTFILWDYPGQSAYVSDDCLAIISPYLPMKEIIQVHDDIIDIAMPMFLVDADGASGEVDHVTLQLPDYLYGPKTGIRLDARQDYQEVFIHDAPSPWDSQYPFVLGRYSGIYNTSTPGTVRLEYIIDYTDVWEDAALVLEYALNGEVVASTDLYEGVVSFNISSAVYIDQINIPPGASELNMTLAFVDLATSGRVVIDSVNQSIYRVTELYDMGSVIGALEGVYTWLVVDPGVHIELNGVLPKGDPDSNHHGLVTTLFDGSTLFLRNITREMNASLRLHMIGNGTAILEDVSVEYLSMDVQGLTINLSRSMSGGLTAEMNGSLIDLRDSNIEGDLDIFLSESRMVVESSTFDLDGDVSNITLYNSVLSALGSTFAGNFARSHVSYLYLGDYGRTSWEFSNIIFKDIVMRVPEFNGVEPRDYTLLLEDCTFTGNASILTMTYYDQWNGETHPYYALKGSASITIEGNQFQGPRAGVVLGYPYHDALVMGNVFTDGAWFYAHYYPDMSFTNRSYWFIAENETAIGDVFDGLVQGSPYEAYLDITGDPSLIEHPGKLLIAVRNRYMDWWPSEIIWFTRVDPVEPPPWIPELAWGPFRFMEFYYDWTDGKGTN